MLRGAGAPTTDRAQLNKTRRALGLQPAEDDLAAWESAELLLVTVPKWFDLAGPFPVNVVHVGPLGIARPTNVTRPVDVRPLVLLSFSTTVCCDPHIGTSVSAGAIRVPGNVEAVPYADHDQLLPRCAAVVTHGGLGTTLRALAHGKPPLLLPLGRDQQFNASRVVDLGAGVRLPLEATPAEIASALGELLTRPRFTRHAERAADAIAADAADETATSVLLNLAHFRQ